MKRAIRSVIILFVILISPRIQAQQFIGRGAVLISHLSPDYAQAADEFVVLYNRTADTIDLNGYEVRYFTASGSVGSAGRSFSETTLLPPDQHLLMSGNDTVVVGSVAVLSDGPFTSGMATTGGQLVLRSSSEPDSVVYAAAWGSVTQYVAGMADAASWTSDGMLSLVWQDTTYARSTYLSSNTEYVHTPSDSIAYLPSQAGPVSPAAGIAWGIRISVVQGSYSDSSVLVGLDDAATDGFDLLLDQPLPPPPAGTSVRTGIYRPDLGLATGDHLLYDIRPLHPLKDTTTRWYLDVWPAESDTLLAVQLDLTGLPSYLPVQLRDITAGAGAMREGDSVLYGFNPGTTDPYRLLIVAGDTTPPGITFISPPADTAIVVGDALNIALSIEELSGIDSLSIGFTDASDSVEYAVIDTTAGVSSVIWPLPRRLLTDSAQVRVFARDSLGNASLHISPSFRIVPDTVRTTLTSGWHSLSVPLERSETSSMFSPSDSVFVFDYSPQRGYAPADSVVPGAGYFVGLMDDKELVLPGIPAVDSIRVPLSAGFVLVSNASKTTLARDDLLFVVDSMQYSYATAVTQSIISSGFFGYDHASGQYQSADSLRPWEAYWIPVLIPGVSLQYPEVVGQGSSRAVPRAREAWELRFRAASNGIVDSLFSIGTHRQARDEFDGKFDVPAPPRPPGKPLLHVFAERPDWKPVIGTRFLRDIRTGTNTHTWSFVVSAPDVQEVTLTVSAGSEEVPGGLEIRDATFYADEWAPLDGRWTYSYTGRGERRFEVRSTTTAMNEEDGAVPERFDVTTNFPNPFNGMTALSVDIPVRGRLAVTIFDLLGRKVDVIEEQHYAAGRHVIPWTATQSSGVYVGEALFRPDGPSELRIRKTWKMLLTR